MPSIVSINTSRTKGEKKKPVKSAIVVKNHGIKGDAHAGRNSKQISLLAIEAINDMKKKGLSVGPGDFAENITTKGVKKIKIGAHIRLGKKVLLQVTHIGKVCHNPCSIYAQAGDCIMPKEGVFAKVIEGGVIKKGDSIKISDS